MWHQHTLLLKDWVPQGTTVLLYLDSRSRCTTIPYLFKYCCLTFFGVDVEILHYRLQSKLPVVPHATGRKLSLYDSRSKPLVPKINRQSSFNERAHAEQNSSGTSWWYSYCHVLVHVLHTTGPVKETYNVLYCTCTYTGVSAPPWPIFLAVCSCKFVLIRVECTSKKVYRCKFVLIM